MRRWRKTVSRSLVRLDLEGRFCLLDGGGLEGVEKFGGALLPLLTASWDWLVKDHN